MAVQIDAAACTACADCEPVCPTSAISPKKGVYQVNTDTCTECEDHADMPQCMEVCQDDCIDYLEN